MARKNYSPPEAIGLHLGLGQMSSAARFLLQYYFSPFALSPNTATCCAPCVPVLNQPSVCMDAWSSGVYIRIRKRPPKLLDLTRAGLDFLVALCGTKNEAPRSP